jgi:prolipoprotein diacylglyceryltransferase
LLYAGLVAGVVAGNAAAHAAGVDAFRVFVATLILIVPALISARLLYVAAHWTHYWRNPGRIWNRAEGGFSMYGGLPVMLLLSVPLLAALHLGFGAFWDVAAFTILVGMIFTRVGCLLNGCCAGRPSRARLSWYLPNRRGVWDRRVPTQFLEAAWAAMLLVFAIAVRHSLPFPGALFLLVAAGYASGRLVFESTREPEPRARRITIGHAISAITVVLSCATLVARWPR